MFTNQTCEQQYSDTSRIWTNQDIVSGRQPFISEPQLKTPLPKMSRETKSQATQQHLPRSPGEKSWDTLKQREKLLSVFEEATEGKDSFAIGTVILLVRVYWNNKLVLVYRQFI